MQLKIKLFWLNEITDSQNKGDKNKQTANKMHRLF